MVWIVLFSVIGVFTLTDWLTYKYIKSNKYIKGKQSRYNEFRIREGFTIYSGCHNLGFRFEPDYDDAEYMQLIMSTMWHQFFVDLPWWKTHGEAVDDSYRFGFYLYNTNPKKLFCEIVFYWKKWNKTVYMPWDYISHHNIIEGRDGQRYIDFQDEYKKRRRRAKQYNAKPLPVDSCWDYYRSEKFSWEAPYEYTTKDGANQRTMALYHIEDREWRPRWLIWCKLFSRNQRVLEIELMDEMGEDVGTWKGGTVAFGKTIGPKEDPHEAYQRIMKTEILD